MTNKEAAEYFASLDPEGGKLKEASIKTPELAKAIQKVEKARASLVSAVEKLADSLLEAYSTLAERIEAHNILTEIETRNILEERKE